MPHVQKKEVDWLQLQLVGFYFIFVNMLIYLICSDKEFIKKKVIKYSFMNQSD